MNTGWQLEGTRYRCTLDILKRYEKKCQDSLRKIRIIQKKIFLHFVSTCIAGISRGRPATIKVIVAPVIIVEGVIVVSAIIVVEGVVVAPVVIVVGLRGWIEPVAVVVIESVVESVVAVVVEPVVAVVIEPVVVAVVIIERLLLSALS